jgi:hypothetical protein
MFLQPAQRSHQKTFTSLIKRFINAIPKSKQKLTNVPPATKSPEDIYFTHRFLKGYRVSNYLSLFFLFLGFLLAVT